jgi:hypothetical protein
LIAWYRFEDGDARDYASSNEYPNITWSDSKAYNGTIKGATYNQTGGTTDVLTENTNSGMFGFNGSNNTIKTGITTDQTSNSYSFSAWAYPKKPNSGTQQIVSSDTGGYDWSILINKSSTGEFEIFTGSGSETHPKSVESSKWYHVVGTWDIENSQSVIYVNGDSKTASGFGTDNDTNSVSIGNNPDSSEYWSGYIDDVRIYDRVLKSDEVDSIYNSTKP